MGYIPEEVVEEVLQKTDILQVISEHIKLTKRGKYYFGRCPFHQEDTPSFSVTPEKQIFYCFGCNTGGNVFKFVALSEGLTYAEAIRKMADRAGVNIPEQKPKNSREQQQRQRAYKIIAAAVDFYRFQLQQPQGRKALNYLKKRGLTDQVIETFQIGYAPDHWSSLIDFLTSKGCREKELVELGLAIKSQQGTKYFDRFRNRVVFPIQDAAGRAVGFGGRALDDSKPKYLNTPETSYFNKRHIVYGLHLSRPAIIEKGFAVVMEGYLDVVTAHQYGIKNAVASLGTALTGEQVNLMKRYTDELLVCYDADAAGLQATLRSLDLIQQEGCRVKVISIPQGKDPDEYIRDKGVEGWHNLINSAYNLIEYKLKASVAKGTPVSVAEKMSVLEEVLPNLAAIKNPVEQEENMKLAASNLNVSWEAIKGELKRFIAKQGKKWSNTDKFTKRKHNIKPMDNSDHGAKSARQKAEYTVLGLILSDYNLFSIAKDKLSINDLQDDQLRKIYALLTNGDDTYINEPAKMMHQLEEREQRLLGRLLIEEIPGENPVEILHDCINTLKNVSSKQRYHEVLNQLKDAEQVGDQQRINTLLQELQQLHQTMNSDLP
ncbi:DNA primase [Desulfofalx alkaliphila]|uniref:DNA primase n=1 Tax=Desulfofalx alkaliphila TaxID=105483 RepID=UPI000AE764B9|nr:DNA primase [Desulfofalx alkaliphila]